MRKFLLATMMTMTFVNSVHSAAYIKFDGVDGEALDKDHNKWIELLSFNYDHALDPTCRVGGGGGGGGSSGDGRHHEPISVSKPVDAATPLLSRAMCTGEPIPEVNIEICGRVNQPCYLKYKLTNVLVTSYSLSTGGSGGEDILTENITLNFEEVKWTFTPPTKEGCDKGKLCGG